MNESFSKQMTKHKSVIGWAAPMSGPEVQGLAPTMHIGLVAAFCRVTPGPGFTQPGLLPPSLHAAEAHCE